MNTNDRDIIEHRITASLGPRPEGRIADPQIMSARRQIANTALIEEELGDERRLEAELTQGPGTVTYVIMLIVCVVVELVGSIHLVKSMGFGNPERTFLGAAFGFLLIAMAYFLAKFAHHRNRLLVWGLWAGFVGLVLSIAVIRMTAIQVEGETLSDSLATVVVMVAAGIGPAVAAELVLSRFLDVWRRRKDLWRVRRRLRRDQKRHDQAQRTLEDVAKAQAEWDRQAAILRAQLSLDTTNTHDPFAR